MADLTLSFHDIEDRGGWDFSDLGMIEAEIAVELEDASGAEIKAAIYRSLLKFSVESRAVIMPLIRNSVAFQEVYSIRRLEMLCGWHVAEVDDVYLNGCQLKPTNRGHGRGVRALSDTFVYNNGRLIVPQALESCVDGLEVLAVIHPDEGTTNVTTEILERYGTILKHGALAALYRMPKKDWESSGTAFSHEAAFYNGVARARGELYGAHRGLVEARVPAEHRFF